MWKDEVAMSWMISKTNYKKEVLDQLPLKKSKVWIQFFAMRFMDYDGAYNAAKPVIDGLTKCGIIFDDSPKYIDLKVEQIKAKNKADERVEILITFD